MRVLGNLEKDGKDGIFGKMKFWEIGYEGSDLGRGQENILRKV